MLQDYVMFGIEINWACLLRVKGFFTCCDRALFVHFDVVTPTP